MRGLSRPYPSMVGKERTSKVLIVPERIGASFDGQARAGKDDERSERPMITSPAYLSKDAGANRRKV